MIKFTYLNLPAKLFLPIFICPLFVLSGFAQKTKVSIKVVNTKREPLPFASITVIPVRDSSQAQHKISDSAGVTTFDLIHDQQYFVEVSSVNHLPFKKGISIKSDHPVFVLMAEVSAKALKGVTITATRPVMRQEDDKTIVDPENLASSSTNAYEILEKTPGLFVDQDGNVYLSSTTPATIYINGREQKMNASDIATMLKNLPPNSIASIEILRSPSARYDASGSGGIVNIVLKKGLKIGLTGSVFIGGNQGKYGTGFIGVNLNNNNGTTTTYVNMQYGHRNNSEDIKTDRLFAADTLLSQDAFSLYPTNNYFLGYGISSQVNKKWEVSYDGRINYSNFINTTTNLSKITKISSAALLTINNSNVSNNGNNFNLNQGLNAKYKIDTLGSEWTSDFSYSYSPGTTNQTFLTTFYSPAIAPVGGDGKTVTALHFLAFQSNLLYKLPKKITIETGVKSTYVYFTNTTDYFRGNGGNRVKDNGRTSSYNYNEMINAAYLQVSKTFLGITVKMGTRMENTNMKGNQLIPTDTSFSIHRTDLFPYVYISRNLFKIMKYDLRAYLVYRRTISRPGDRKSVV